MDTTKCPSCAAEVPGDMRFCQSCGKAIEHAPAPAPEPAVPPADTANTTPDLASMPEMPEEDEATMGWSETPVYPVHNPAPANNRANAGYKPDFKGISLKAENLKKFKKPAIIAGAAVVAIIAIIVAITVFSPSRYESIKGSVYIAQGEDSVIIIPNGKQKNELDGYPVNAAYNLDGTKAVVLISDDDYTGSDGYSLYFVDDKPVFISDNVYSFWFAASGNAVAYSKDRDSASNTAELWLYSAGGGNTRLSSDFYIYGNGAISPDGKTVAFVQSDGERRNMAVWDGKLNVLDRDADPVAIADKARYIYYNRNDSLYVQPGYDGDKREKLGDNVYRLHANRDLSQVVYTFGSSTYISIKGGNRESLSGSATSFILPRGTRMAYSNNAVVYGISSFADTFYLNTNDAIIRINNKYETDSIVRGVNRAYLADNGKTLTYLRNEKIYRVDGSSSRPEPEEIVDGDVMSFVATSDGKTVFYSNEFSELFYQKGNNKTTVSSDLSSRQYSLFGKNTLFFVSDDELYTSGGERGRRVNGIEGDVQWVSADMQSVLVRSYDYGDALYYRSTDGNKFELIHHD